MDKEDYVTGGNVRHSLPSRSAFWQRHTFLRGFLFLGSGLGGGALLGFIVFPLIMGGSMQQSELATQVSSTSVLVDHALARGTDLATILDKPGTYTDHTFKDITTRITAGSCGTTANNAYTVISTDTHDNIVIFTTRHDANVIGDIAKKSALLAQVCAE